MSTISNTPVKDLLMTDAVQSDIKGASTLAGALSKHLPGLLIKYDAEGNVLPNNTLNDKADIKVKTTVVEEGQEPTETAVEDAPVADLLLVASDDGKALWQQLEAVVSGNPALEDNLKASKAFIEGFLADDRQADDNKYAVSDADIALLLDILKIERDTPEREAQREKIIQALNSTINLVEAFALNQEQFNTLYLGRDSVIVQNVDSSNTEEALGMLGVGIVGLGAGLALATGLGVAFRGVRRAVYGPKDYVAKTTTNAQSEAATLIADKDGIYTRAQARVAEITAAGRRIPASLDDLVSATSNIDITNPTSILKYIEAAKAVKAVEPGVITPPAVPARRVPPIRVGRSTVAPAAGPATPPVVRPSAAPAAEAPAPTVIVEAPAAAPAVVEAPVAAATPPAPPAPPAVAAATPPPLPLPADAAVATPAAGSSKKPPRARNKPR